MFHITFHYITHYITSHYILSHRYTLHYTDYISLHDDTLSVYSALSRHRQTASDGPGSGGASSHRWKEEDAEAANDLLQPPAAAAQPTLPADSVPRSSGTGGTRRFAWPNTDTGIHRY